MDILTIIMLSAAAVLIIASVILLVRKILDDAHDNRVMAEYQREMDEKRKEKAKAAEKKKTYYTTYNEREDPYIPKYAAGDDMDKINRNAREFFQPPRRETDPYMNPKLPLKFGLVMAAIAALREILMWLAS